MKNKAFGDCEGPLGIPMKSEVAQTIESVIKSLPADCKEAIKDGPVRLAKSLITELKEGDRDDISLITNGALDRDHEVLLPGGGDWDQFRKAGMPVTWAHDYDGLPIGRAKWVKRVRENGDDAWLARTHYIEAPPNWKGDWFGDAVWHFVSSKVLNGKSVGFIPLQMHMPTTDEIKKRPQLAEARMIFDKWMVLEYAVAPIQANPDALMLAASKSAKKGMLAKIFADCGVLVPDGVYPPQPQAPVVPAVPEPMVKVFTAADINHRIKSVVDELVAEMPMVIKEVLDSLRGRV